MKSILVVTILTILRLGIPALTLLLIGEGIKAHDRKVQIPTLR